VPSIILPASTLMRGFVRLLKSLNCEGNYTVQ
jgi:hypothetical protein